MKKVATIPQAGETKRRKWGDPRSVEEQPHSALGPRPLQVAVTPQVFCRSKGWGGGSWRCDTVPFEADVG